MRPTRVDPLEFLYGSNPDGLLAVCAATPLEPWELVKPVGDPMPRSWCRKEMRDRL